MKFANRFGSEQAPAEVFMLGARMDLLLWLIGEAEKLSATHAADSFRLSKLLFIAREGFKSMDEQVWPPASEQIYGPFSPSAYEDLAWLESMQFIEVRLVSAKCQADAYEYELLEEKTRDFFHPKRKYTYLLTTQGRRALAQLQLTPDYQKLMNTISQWRMRSTGELLRYLFVKYPEYGAPPHWLALQKERQKTRLAW